MICVQETDETNKKHINPPVNRGYMRPIMCTHYEIGRRKYCPLRLQSFSISQLGWKAMTCAKAPRDSKLAKQFCI